jgi:LCP family protein required for cell wall assembly
MSGTIPTFEPTPLPDATRTRRRRRSFWRITLVLVLLLLIGGFCGFCVYTHTNPLQAVTFFTTWAPSFVKEKVAPTPPFGGRDHVNILLLGADVSFDHSGTARTDTIKYISVDLKAPRISVLSIPRDTWVDVPNHRNGRINGAYQLGGRYEADRIALARATVEGLLSEYTETPVTTDYYIRIQTGGFIKIIDALGGVQVDVEKDMDYEDPSQELFIHLKKGPQRLDGYNAMCYIRFRHDAEGDYGRIRRQDQLMHALANELSAPEARGRLPRILGPIMSMMVTDIAKTDIIALKRIVDQVGTAGIHTLTLPTVPCHKGAASVVEVQDTRAAAQTIGELFTGPRPTVTVLNGSGRPGMGGEVGDALDTDVYNVIGVGNTAEPAVTSAVYALPRCLTQANALAASLGITTIDTKTPAPTGTFGRHAPPPPAEITVVLGGDYTTVPAQESSTAAE